MVIDVLCLKKAGKNVFVPYFSLLWLFLVLQLEIRL